MTRRIMSVIPSSQHRVNKVNADEYEYEYKKG